ncbi:MAG: iron transporter FeoA [Promethearchaeota archaeon Loki_b32]|nr:ferrous iron transport protein A [Candidatus Lokiarchaeota archaeon]MCK4479492.1 ferrous iron transport protein A [Candidatus Lokiarchaeota archaeon]TKJ18758.1 MAG: iron transporter FeoA [Candidatus Lokiarchaeota archaeon Loki_b32]
MKSKFESSKVQFKRKKVAPLIKRLIDCPIGGKLKVLRVNTGHHAKRRLANLGILPGVIIIKRKAAPFRGPIEVIVKGSLLVIGRGLAARIIVINENSE